MLNYYFQIAIRNFWKGKAFSAINIVGLAVGLSSFWTICLYIADEFSYDSYHLNADKIYRVAQKMNWDGGSLNIAPTAPPMAPTLKNDYPEIQEVVRLDAQGGGSFIYSNIKIQVNDAFLCDSTFFKIFTFTFLSGDKRTALSHQNSIVLTKTLAEKLFANVEAAINKTIIIDNIPTLVTGVITDVPGNSHFSFSALRPFPGRLDDDWNRSYLYTYILLNNKTSIKELEAKLPAFYNNHLKASMGEMNCQMELQPLLSIHLHSNLDYELGSNGSFINIYIFTLVASLILLMAFANYANLSTVQGIIRIKEIGIRKISGSTASQLIGMFLTESVLLTFIAGTGAILLMYSTFPFFQQLAGKSLSIWRFGIVKTFFTLVSFSLAAGLVSGLYPALMLSRFNAIPALKGQAGSRLGSDFFRKSLITFQFVITIGMIAGSITIYRQLQYTSVKDLGFNKNQVITFHIDNPEVRTKVSALKEELLRSPFVESVATSSNLIGNNNIGGSDYKVEINGSMDSKARIAKEFMVDENFISTLQIKMLKGRNFSTSMPTDKYKAILVNETLAKDAGWENPVGKKIETGKDSAGRPIYRIVIGIVNDFHIYSLQHKVEPLILLLPDHLNDRDNIYVRLNSKHIVEGVNYVEQAYKKLNVGNKLDYSFLNQNFSNHYKAEQRQGVLLNIFTILSLVICSLGLFGLIKFNAKQRVREVGIRKVLGATISSIVILLSRDFLRLITIASLITMPISWYVMNKWLEDFAYHISLDSSIFIIAGLFVLVITFITISFESIKAAIANPVKSLKND